METLFTVVYDDESGIQIMIDDAVRAKLTDEDTAFVAARVGDIITRIGERLKSLENAN